MRKIVIGLAMASTALTAPAMAREGQWYVEGNAGVMLVEDVTGLLKADQRREDRFGAAEALGQVVLERVDLAVELLFRCIDIQPRCGHAYGTADQQA